MSDLTQLYQEIILNHNRRPFNYGDLEDYTGKARGHNPLCGDEVTVFWRCQGEMLAKISFRAQGCAISRASASIMTKLLEGKTWTEAQSLFADLDSFLQAESDGGTLDDRLGDLVALSGVRRYPSRVKCATLAWHTLLDAGR